MEISITCGDKKMYATLHNTSTAYAIYNALPIKGNLQLWGNEAYFEIPVSHALENNASEVVPVGSLAFWPQGNCFCIFWGQTPISAVNIFGVIHTNLTHVYSLQNNEKVVIEKKY